MSAEGSGGGASARGRAGRGVAAVMTGSEERAGFWVPGYRKEGREWVQAWKAELPGDQCCGQAVRTGWLGGGQWALMPQGEVEASSTCPGPAWLWPGDEIRECEHQGERRPGPRGAEPQQPPREMASQADPGQTAGRCMPEAESLGTVTWGGEAALALGHPHSR